MIIPHVHLRTLVFIMCMHVGMKGELARWYVRLMIVSAAKNELKWPGLCANVAELEGAHGTVQIQTGLAPWLSMTRSEAT